MSRTSALIVVLALVARCGPSEPADSADSSTSSGAASAATTTLVPVTTAAPPTSTPAPITTTTSTTTAPAPPVLTTKTLEGDGFSQPDRPVVHIRQEFIEGLRPLVMVLHPYAGSAEDAVWEIIEDAVADRGWIVIAPSGMVDSEGNRYWAATPTCCDRDGRRNDDVGYLRRILEDALARHPVDPAHVVVVGGSNGGFMAMQLACHASDLVTAIVVVAASDVNAERACQPDLPVSVFHIHGRGDSAIRFDGGELSVLAERIAPYPSAEETVRRWTVRDGCPAIAPTEIPEELADHRVWRGCEAGTTVEFAWTNHDHDLVLPGGLNAAVVRFISEGVRRPNDLFDRYPGPSSLTG
jgi:polyhydroxybutyrate depolymerase